MRLIYLLICSFVLVSPSAEACRSMIKHNSPTSEEAFNSADLIVSGPLSKIDKDAKDSFSYTYRVNIERIWKGKLESKTVSFKLQHHTCAKYRGEFSLNQLVVIYLTKHNDAWDLIRISPSDADFSQDVKAELKFLEERK